MKFMKLPYAWPISLGKTHTPLDERELKKRSLPTIGREISLGNHLTTRELWLMGFNLAAMPFKKRWP